MHGPILPKFMYSQIGCRIFKTSLFLNSKGNLVVGGSSTRQICTNNRRGLGLPKLFNKSMFGPSLQTRIESRFGKVFARSFIGGQGPQEFGGAKTLERFRRRDGVPKSYDLIYRSNFPVYLLYSQILVFLTTGAIITAALIYLTAEKQTEEEIEARRKLQKKLVEEMDRKDRESAVGKLVYEFKEKDTITAKPNVEDIFEADSLQMSLVVMSFIVLAVALFKLQRVLPVRIYMNEKNHCIAVTYGHFIPGAKTWLEFVAGTVVPYKGNHPSNYESPIYKDGSGRTMVLIDRFFRTPSDYNRIMGFQREEDDIRKSNDKS